MLLRGCLSVLSWRQAAHGFKVVVAMASIPKTYTGGNFFDTQRRRFQKLASFTHASTNQDFLKTISRVMLHQTTQVFDRDVNALRDRSDTQVWFPIPLLDSLQRSTHMRIGLTEDFIIRRVQGVWPACVRVDDCEERIIENWFGDVVRM